MRKSLRCKISFVANALFIVMSGLSNLPEEVFRQTDRGRNLPKKPVWLMADHRAEQHGAKVQLSDFLYVERVTLISESAADRKYLLREGCCSNIVSSITLNW
ncbi:MAG TPA: hypothetical protein ENJ14_02800 [Bacteroidetes bacterium]|nr:hypothetical protein [Bacteroidota bacterium]